MNASSARNTIEFKDFYIYLLPLAFLAFPFLGFRFLRFKIGLLEIPLFSFIYIIVFTIYFFERLNTDNFIINLSKYQKYYFVTYIIFIFLHLVSLFRTNIFDKGVVELVKILFAAFMFFTIAIIFNKITGKIEIIIKAIIISSSIIILIYIIRYIFVFQLSYISIDWHLPSRTGKNQFGFYLSVVSPLVLWNYLRNPRHYFWFISVLIHIFGTLYVLSRGTWITIILGYGLIFIKFIRDNKVNVDLKRKILIRTILIIIIFAMLFVIDIAIIPKKDISNRFQSLLFIRDIYGEQSISIRLSLLQNAFNKFLSNPIAGIGFLNFYYETGYATHNDYLGVLTELGIIGFIVFMTLNIIVLLGIFKKGKDFYWADYALKNSAINILVYLFFINAYTNSMIYIVFALMFIFAANHERD